MPRYLSDEALAQAIKEHGSAYLVAKHHGMSSSSLIRRAGKLGLRDMQSTSKTTALAAKWTLHENRHVSVSVPNGTVVVASDLHVWPGEDTTAIKALFATVKHLKPTALVLNGDVFDGASASRHDSLEWNKLPAIQEELSAVRSFLERLKSACESSGVKIRLMTMGNHENRFVRTLAARASAFEGVEGFDIRDHFPGWDICYRVTINEGTDGWTDVIHNWAGGIHAAYNNALRSGINYVTGHTHRLMDRPWRDRRGRRYGIETGTCIDLDGPQTYYTAGRPTDWQAGFVVLTYHDSKLLRPEYVDVLEHGKISFRSQVVEV